MADYVPPPGPPPPRVPEGWKAVWSDQYKEWFYVNLYTKQSTWEKPTEPAHPPDSHHDAPPGGPPPSYSAGSDAPHVSDSKHPLESNNPYNSQRRGDETDEQLAKRLQEEENGRNRGAADEFYNTGAGTGTPGIQGGYPGAASPLPARPDSSSGKSKGFLGKLLGKSSSSHSSYQQPGYPQAGGYGQSAAYGQGYGGYPQQAYGGGYPPQGYPMAGGYGGGYGGGYAAAAPARRTGGMGAGGAAALGLGGGLLGGMLLGEAMDGGDDGGDGGGDYGGGDMGGGDMGGGDF